MVGTAAYLEDHHSDSPRPRVTRLLPNSPNPFRDGTIIRFELAHPGRATVSVFDVGGRLVKAVLDAVVDAGAHEILWNGDSEQGSAAAGIYFVRLTTRAGVETRKLVRSRSG